MSKVVLREGDTAYVQVDGLPNPAQWAAVSNINWLELAQQKHRLVSMIWDKPDDILWGIVHLIDAIQDDAEEGGQPVVFVSEYDEEEHA